MTRPTLIEAWASKMTPEALDARMEARRRRRSESGHVTAGGAVMLAFAVLLWVYLAANVAWWAVR